MYTQDSFFDLTLWGRIGLVGISAVLFLLMLFAAWRALSGMPFWLRIISALGLFYVFVWVSPQIYYMYYRMIIPDLPLQWVIWPRPNIWDAMEMLIFQGPQNLSAHSQGLLGWAIVAVAIFRRRGR